MGVPASAAASGKFSLCLLDSCSSILLAICSSILSGTCSSSDSLARITIDSVISTVLAPGARADAS